MGILICGLNGTGKSTIGKALSERIRYEFIDNEELYFKNTDSTYKFDTVRSKEEVISLLYDRIIRNNRYVFASVKGDYGDKLISTLEYVILVEVPKNIRKQRVRDRSYKKFGDKILEGGDLFEKESQWFSIIDNRSDEYVKASIEKITCPVILIDGTLPVEDNVNYIVSVLNKN